MPPLLRKTGARSPWLPGPLQETLERVQPALVVMAIVPSVLLGGNAQFTGRLPRDEDTSRPARPAIVVQQPVPVPGASAWMPRPLDSGTPPPPDALRPPILIAGQQPIPRPSFWAPTPAREANTDPLRPTIVQAKPPDPSLALPSATWVGRLPRDEDTSRPARPAIVSGPPVPIPGAQSITTYAPRDIPPPPPDRLSPVAVLRGQQPIPPALALPIGRITSTPTDRVLPVRIATGDMPIPQGGAQLLRAPRDVVTLPDRLPTGAVVQVLGVPPPGALAIRVGRITSTPLERVPWRGPVVVLSSGLAPPSAGVLFLRAVRDGSAPIVIGPGHILTPQTRARAFAPQMQRTWVLPARDRTFSEDTS